jgi:transcription factor E2F3
VLEGIGLIEKKSKNNIQWNSKGMGLTSSGELRAELDALKKDINSLQGQEMMLDDYILLMQSSLRELAEDEENAQYAYTSMDDVRNLPKMKGETLIAIKAPPGTTLEVPDPDEGMEEPNRRYQIFLKSANFGPIDIFLVSHINDREVYDSQGGVNVAEALHVEPPIARAAGGGSPSQRATELERQPADGNGRAAGARCAAR